MKNHYRVMTAGGSTRLEHQTLDRVKAAPEARTIEVFDERLQDYTPSHRRVDGQWVREACKPLLS